MMKNVMTKAETAQWLSDSYGVPFAALDGLAPVWRAQVDGGDWLWIAHLIRSQGGRLAALWGRDARPAAPHCIVSVAYAVAQGLVWLELAVQDEGEPTQTPTQTQSLDSAYPDLSALFPAAARMQRAVFDLLGVAAQDFSDRRPWLNHGKWPQDYFPLRSRHTGLEQFDTPLVEYPFVQIIGDGAHEIAVGPIHAGIIEPGHFRFSVVGEKVLRLEQRLGYTHKGTGKLFTRRHLADGHQLAARLCGDSTVAFSWAYCMAAEAASGCAIPPRAAWWRALLQERERIANHLGDLGALGNDAGLAVGLAQFTRLKEDWLRLNGQLFGHRLLMDCIVPGGVAIDLAPEEVAPIQTQCEVIEIEVRALQAIYEGHSGLQDRLIASGCVTPALAAQLGLCGLAGRASGQNHDLRVDHPMLPYNQLKLQKASHDAGDVAARVLLRFQEVFESLRLLREMASHLCQASDEPSVAALPPCHSAGRGVGWVEGWRGPVLVVIEHDAGGGIVACHCHDPSWHNWPVLEHAIMGNIVPDFPLINKSFNLSYSGQDL
jgi:Ni,Fe-hydrogenase III large subunit/Ni,Fe-hydrogenase III component G